MCVCVKEPYSERHTSVVVTSTVVDVDKFTGVRVIGFDTKPFRFYCCGGC